MPGRSAALFWKVAFSASALSACGAQDLNGGLLFDRADDGGQSADSGDDVPFVVEPGGSGGAGGATVPSSGGGGGASCSNVSPCGGEVVGAWTVTSSCLGISGELDLSMLGFACASAPVIGALRVAGDWTASSAGTYVDNTITTGDEMLSVPASCLEVSGTAITCDTFAQGLRSGLGYATVGCMDVASGGCTCAATVNQAGTMGRVSVQAETRGTYTSLANVITLDGAADYSYCVSGDTMTWTPRTASPTTTGTIVFQRSVAGGSSGSGGAGGTGGAGGATVVGKLPCDVYADDGGPCVAAHSTVRALSAAYAGPLYQLRRIDGQLRDIPVQSPGGFADANAHDTFCAGWACTISTIYDQSGLGNHLTRAPAGGAKPTPGNEADALALPVTFSGQKVYGVHVVPGVGYRNNTAVGTATGDNPETIYMVADGTYYNSGCCFDYGNAETNNYNNGEGAVEAVYFGSCRIWGSGAGQGPWVMGDLENGLWAGNTSPYQGNPSVTYGYVTAMVKGGSVARWMIRVGNAQSGALDTAFDGPRPSSRYSPMRKEGAIILGIAGDNSNGGQGNFFEGVMTAHFSSDTADQAVQASIVSAYGR